MVGPSGPFYIMASNIFYRLLKFIQDKLVKYGTAALTAWLKTQMGGWFLGKIIDFTVGKINEDIVDPFTDVLVVRMAHKFDVVRARGMVKKLELAQGAKDEAEYRRLVDKLIGGM